MQEPHRTRTCRPQESHKWNNMDAIPQGLRRKMKIKGPGQRRAREMLSLIFSFDVDLFSNLFVGGAGKVGRFLENPTRKIQIEFQGRRIVPIPLV